VFEISWSQLSSSREIAPDSHELPKKVTPKRCYRYNAAMAKSKTNDEQPWYQEGLAFECSQCGDCCTGGPGYVWVTNDEIAALAKEVGEDIERFEAKYVRKIGVRKSLDELPDRDWDCVFLDPETRGCTVYDVRPKQCRTWPFWDSNLESPKTWKKTCEICPGSGVGELHDIEHIENLRKQVRV